MDGTFQCFDCGGRFEPRAMEIDDFSRPVCPECYLAAPPAEDVAIALLHAMGDMEGFTL
jgi:hypothetical protein